MILTNFELGFLLWHPCGCDFDRTFRKRKVVIIESLSQVMLKNKSYLIGQTYENQVIISLNTSSTQTCPNNIEQGSILKA